MGAIDGYYKYKFILLHSQAYPVLHQNKPSRESIFCGKVGGWLSKRALIMLNFLLKTRQNYLYCIHAHELLNDKHVRLGPPAWAVAGHAVLMVNGACIMQRQK